MTYMKYISTNSLDNYSKVHRYSMISYPSLLANLIVRLYGAEYWQCIYNVCMQIDVLHAYLYIIRLINQYIGNTDIYNVQ